MKIALIILANRLSKRFYFEYSKEKIETFIIGNVVVFN